MTKIAQQGQDIKKGQVLFLVLLRMAVGWHFLYEAYPNS